MRIIRFAAILGLLVGAGPAPADIPGCPKADIPPAARKGLQKAAKHEYAGSLDLTTLYYCASRGVARALVDTVPVPQSDGSEDAGTLSCTGSPDHARDWICQVDLYRAIRLVPAPGQPEVQVEVDERATPESTRAYAQQAFDLLSQPARVEACTGGGHAQATESLRAVLARRHGPYRLVISREGFALLRGAMQVRFRSANELNPRAQIQCWVEVNTGD